MASYVELHIDQGATFTNSLTLTNEVTNANINLALYSVSSKMRRSFYSANASNIVCTITDAQNGAISMTMTAANTALLKAGRYVYDLTITDSASVVTRLIEGPVFVHPKVT